MQETQSINEMKSIDKIEATLNRSEREKVIELNEKNGVVYLTYPSLTACDFITHAFSTRIGGVSQGMFSTMNLSFTRGDEEQAVRENFRRIAAAIGVSVEDMVFSDQTHTTNVRVITEADRGNGITRPKDFFEVDGMITNVPGLVLTTFYADCVPLYFVDPVHHAIGLSHSGWRGTVGKIGQKTIELMQQTYNTDPADIIAAIGPSICKSCYEISEDVAREFQSAFPEEACTQFLDLAPTANSQALEPDLKANTQAIELDPILPESSPKYHLDLWKANQLILAEAGVPESNITLPDLCTNHNPDLLFSHRYTQGHRGNLAAFLSITK